MLVSRSWLQNHFETKLPSAEKIADTLMMHAFELEGVTEIKGDSIINIDVLPNRAHDCLSYSGIAREYAVLTGYELKKDRYYYSDSVSYESKYISVTNDNPKQCYRYMTRVISNVVIEDSPGWLKDRVESIGQRSINNIVDATNYVMFDTGNPMHAFDADKVVGGITIRNANEGEIMTTLTDEELELSSGDLVIADDEGILALAGIKGGKKAEVTHSTKNIILEVANFNPTTTRTTSRKVKILTDSSKRFENEISSEIAPVAMEAISRLVSGIMKNESIGLVVDVYPEPETQHVIKVRHMHINRLLGLSLEIKQVKNIFSQMKYDYRLDGDVFIIHIPFNRIDLRIPEDIIEEVGRIYGYHNIPTKNLDTYNFLPIPNQKIFVENSLKQLLITQGLSELKNYSFVRKGDVKLANPLASDKSALRKDLHKQMLRSLETNIHNIDFFGDDRVAIFEIGRIYELDSESDICCIAIQNKDKKANKKHGNERAQLEKIINHINNYFNVIIDPEFESNSVSFNISKCFNDVDSYGDIFDSSSYDDSSQFHSISSFPYVTRDISFWSPDDLSEIFIKSKLLGSKINHLKRLHVFDTFKKENRVSYGFTLVFQSHEKTLTDEEVNQTMIEIEQILQPLGCEIR